MFNHSIDKYLSFSNNVFANTNQSPTDLYPCNHVNQSGSIFAKALPFGYGMFMQQPIFCPNYFWTPQPLNFYDMFASFDLINSTIQNFTNLTKSLSCLLGNKPNIISNTTNNSNLILPEITPGTNSNIISDTKVNQPTLNTNISQTKVADLESKIFKPQSLNTLSTKNDFLNMGYNAQKGAKLANDAMQHRRTTPLAKGEVGSCAKFVKNAILRSGLGEYVNGDAWQCADILSQNKNFKEIQVSPENFSKLPAGCVVVYPKGDAGFSSKYGHILITKGDGSSISQFASDTTKPSSKARVFMPV